MVDVRAAVAKRLAALVDRHWLEDPTQHPIGTSAPFDAVELLDTAPTLLRLRAGGLRGLALALGRRRGFKGVEEAVKVHRVVVDG